METKNKVLLTIGILVVLGVVLYFTSLAITKYTGYAVNEANLDDFAKCLSKKGVRMYGAFWCGHCQNQKAMFKDAFQYIDYAECDPRGENARTDLCLEAGIQGYPTWEINNKLYSGEMSLQKLAELSGCELNKS